MIKKLLAMLLCCIFLAGCSGQAGSPVEESLPTNVPSVPPDASRTNMPPEELSASLIIDRNIIYDIDCNEETDMGNGTVAGTQFYQGEQVLLEVKAYDYKPAYLVLIDGEYQKKGGDKSELYSDSGLYIRRMDGTRELLIPGAQLVESIGSILSEEEKEKEINVLTNNAFIVSGTWYVDEEGNCYYTTYPCSIMGRSAVGKECFLKLDKGGKLLYKTVLEPGFEAEGFGCADGKMYVILGGKTEGAKVKRVVPFDPETGVLADTDAFVLKNGVEDRVTPFGWGEDGLYLYDDIGADKGKGKGIKKVNLSDGSVSDFLSFAGSAWSRLGYPWKMKGFRVLEGGSVETLYFCEESDNGRLGAVAQVTLERMSLVEGERKKITLRAATIPAWIKLCTAEFNKTDGVYWVVLEELSASKSADLADYARKTNVELSAGKGPDILCGDLVKDYLQGMLAKGMLLELGSAMETMGISESDCLPVAFGSWRDGNKIYGINAAMSPKGYKIRKDALPAGTGELDIRSLMNALSAREEGAIYYELCSSEWILNMFFEGSEDLWGMVDWKNGTCDFSGDLFAQILEASKRYGYDGMHKYQGLVRTMNYRSIYRYDSRAELEAEDMMMSGVLFDDGCYGAVDDQRTLAVNAASPRKEGALKFLGYLLDEQSQAQITQAVPVNRAALDKWIQNELEEVADGKEYTFGNFYIDEGEVVRYSKTFTEADITQERIAEYLEALENVRVLPYRTAPILDIVYTEAADYFSGSKSIEDVAEVIRNRVQLYLDENK